MRFFKNTWDHEAKAIAVDEKEITVKYNPFGLYVEDGGNRIHEDNFERIGDDLFKVEKEYLEDELNVEINFDIYESEFDEEDGTEYLLVTKEQKDNLIKLGNFNDTEEDYFSGDKEVFTELNDKNEISDSSTLEDFYGEVDGFNGYECYEYWDGNNWSEIAFGESWEEVTDEFEGWDDKINLNCSSRNNATGKDYYAIKNSENEWKIIREEWSRYQGSENEYDEVGDVIECLYAFEGIDIEDESLSEYFYRLLDQANENYEAEMPENAKLIWDNDTIALKYKSDVYHIDFDDFYFDFQLGYEHYNDSFDDYDEFREEYVTPKSFSFILEKAVQGIEKRRKERLEEYLTNNINDIELNKIFVERQDSLNAGNCTYETDSFIDELISKLGLENRNIALRADVLLQIRNDNFTKRAVVKSYLTRYSK